VREDLPSGTDVPVHVELHAFAARARGSALCGALQEHRRVLREAFARRGGVEGGHAGGRVLCRLSDCVRSCRGGPRRAGGALSRGASRADGDPHGNATGYRGGVRRSRTYIGQHWRDVALPGVIRRSSPTAIPRLISSRRRIVSRQSSGVALSVREPTASESEVSERATEGRTLDTRSGHVSELVGP